MLLKWLFTALAILWLIDALRPYFAAQPTRRQAPSPPPSPSAPAASAKPAVQQSKVNEDDEYIDFEEIK